MILNVTGGNIDEKEIQVYLDRAHELYGSMVSGMDVEVLSEDEVHITYHILSERPFERVRRITGYLVGTLDRWNNAKRAEERDRIKHGE